ncbi:hypothetical protein BDQ17DRAFT_1203974, partial [Cyathus striatus]
ATSVDVECVFSCRQLILSHVHSCLSVKSIRAVLCIGNWSISRYVSGSNVEAISKMPEV